MTLLLIWQVSLALHNMGMQKLHILTPTQDEDSMQIEQKLKSTDCVDT